MAQLFCFFWHSEKSMLGVQRDDKTVEGPPTLKTFCCCAGLFVYGYCIYYYFFRSDM